MALLSTLIFAASLIAEVGLLRAYRLALPMLADSTERAALQRARPSGAFVFCPMDGDARSWEKAVLFYRNESGEVDLVKVVADTADPHFWTACRTSYFHASPSFYAALPACDFRRFYSFCIADDDA